MREADQFMAGHVIPDADMAKLKQEGRPSASFNNAAKFLRSLNGVERATRKEIQFMSRELHKSPENDLGELATKIHDPILQMCQGPAERSRAFDDMNVRGIGCTNPSLDTSVDAEGRIIVERIDVMEMGWDTSARKLNMRDARFVWREREIPLDVALVRWPDKELILRGNRGIAGPDGPFSRDSETIMINPQKAVPSEIDGPA